MKNLYLYLIVFISGAAVLAVEILGTRILGPFYGVSLFLWSALITVTLAALSLGYAVGGRWADKNATRSRLCAIVAIAGAWLLLIPWLKQPLLVLTKSFGLRFAVLASAFVLFAPPLTLLGMVSPFAIKLKTASLNVVGRTAGNLYAISTVASVVSALLTGFFLIPNVGIKRLMFAIGALLLITAAVGLIAEKKSQLKALGMTFILFSIAAGWILPSNEADPGQGLLAVEQSSYAEIRVLEVKNRRHLLIDGGTHTIVDPSTWESRFPYVAVMDLAKSFFEKPGDLLLIGLGGGSVVKNFAQDGWKVDAVEIDPVVVKVAQDHFGLVSSEGNIFEMDGRQYLLAHEKNYDIVAMDAFGSSSIPFHLVTEEAFALIASRLKPNGVLAINVEALGWHHLLVRSLAATLKKSFSQVLALPTYQPPERIGNIVMLASNREIKPNRPMKGDITDLNYVLTPLYYQDQAWSNRFVPDTREVPVLTDDLNLVDIWAEATNLVARKDLHNYFEESGLSW